MLHQKCKAGISDSYVQDIWTVLEQWFMAYFQQKITHVCSISSQDSFGILYYSCAIKANFKKKINLEGHNWLPLLLYE